MALSFGIHFRGGLQRTFVSYDTGVYGKVHSTNPSSSIVNDFIPYHALMSGNLLSVGDSKALLYNLDFNNSIDSNSKGYENFFYYLIRGENWVKLDKKNTLLNYRCRAGQLVVVSKENNATPLVTLVVSKEHLFNINKLNPDFSKFFIVISREFSESTEHAILYKNFYRQYLDIAKEYVDIIYTKSITKFCYKQVPIVPINPKTISESRSMYQSMTYNILRAMAFHQYT